MILIARAEILYGNRKYQPGDILPADPELRDAWLSSGAAVDADVSEILKKKADPLKARRKSAMAGLPGRAVNGETEEELAGRVPITEKRRKQ